MAFPSNNCDPRLIVVEESQGCTLTRANISAWTKEDIENNYFKEIGMDKIIASTKEARLAGVRERGLTDLLLSRHVSLKETKASDQGSIIAPFSLVPRRNVVNANYFQLEAGAAHPSAGAGGVPASAWNITVNVGSSPWVSSPSQGLKNLEKYFLPDQNVLIEYVDGSNVSQSAQFKVISAVNADSGSTSKATVTLVPNKTDAGWAALTSAQKAVFQPTAGQLCRLANSVSDFESWGHQYPAYNNITILEYWRQTHRWAHTYTEEYLTALKAPLTSDTWRKFRTLPIAEQRRQQEMLNEMDMYNTFFYGQEINEKQSSSTYSQLPLVYDPADPACPLEYKANTLGVRTQLDRCGRVNDRQGQPMDLDTLFESCYTLKRHRETTSGTIDRIDAFTDRHTKARIRDLMFKYYKTKYSSDLQGYYQLGQKITFNNATVFEFDIFDLPDQGVQLVIFTDPYFDDRLAAFSAAQKNRGRGLWLIDWTDVMINVIKTNSRRTTTNLADELYRYVITPNVKHTMLFSKTFEVRIGDGSRSLLIENFSDACPTLTVASCDLTTN